LGGGHSGNVLIAPMTLHQFAEVVSEIKQVQNDPWIQTYGVDGQFLFVSYSITDKSIARGQAMNLAPPRAPLRHIFS